MPSESRYGRLIKSEKKAPRPSSSVDDMYRTFVWHKYQCSIIL